MIRWKVPLYKILVEKDDIKNITNVVQRGMHWAEGPEIEEFEKTLAEYLGVNYCVAMNSGTSALHATMLAYNIKKNDEVLIPSFTFVSTANAALMVQALKTVPASGGTARRAKLEYFIAAGKTGTARKAGPGGYLPGKYYASFIGFFPADSPELCIYIAVDEPKESYYGGLVAAPVFRGIAERVAGYLGLRADPQALAKSSTRR